MCILVYWMQLRKLNIDSIFRKDDWVKVVTNLIKMARSVDCIKHIYRTNIWNAIYQQHHKHHHREQCLNNVYNLPMYLWGFFWIIYGRWSGVSTLCMGAGAWDWWVSSQKRFMKEEDMCLGEFWKTNVQ